MITAVFGPYTQVDVNSENEVDRFCAKFKANKQAPEIYQQILEFELENLDLDLDEVPTALEIFIVVEFATFYENRAFSIDSLRLCQKREPLLLKYCVYFDSGWEENVVMM